MTPVDTVLQALDRQGKSYKQTGGNHWQASSPLREDRRPSLSITVGTDGAVLLKDFGGGETSDILAALGLAFEDLYPQRQRRQTQYLNFNQPDQIYVYRDANGVEVCQALRYNILDEKGRPDKDFRVRHAENGKWIWGKPKNTPLYRLPELLSTPIDEWIYIPEGEKDVDNLLKNGLPAVCNIGGAAVKWTDDWLQTLAGRRVCLLADNDQAGLKRVEELGDLLGAVAKEIKTILPEHLNLVDMPKSDVSDALLMNLLGPDDLRRLTDTLPPREVKATPPHRKLIYERDELLNTAFPDPVFLVDALLPEQSLGILAGRPKIGKSWLALQLANAIADGANFLGKTTGRGRVLFLALEDNPRRIKNRLQALGINSWAGITFAFGWPDLVGDDGLERLYRLVSKNEYRLVVIDTFSRAVAMRPDDIKGIVEVWGRLQEIAFNSLACIVVIDHHRKTFNGADDVVDAVMDSTAKTAVADFIMGLYRPQRERIGILRATGRDIDDLSLNIKFNPVTCSWELLGETEEVASREVEEKILDAIDDLGEAATGMAIVEYVELAKGYVYQTLDRLVKEGKVKRQGFGKPYTR